MSSSGGRGCKPAVWMACSLVMASSSEPESSIRPYLQITRRKLDDSYTDNSNIHCLENCNMIYRTQKIHAHIPPEMSGEGQHDSSIGLFCGKVVSISILGSLQIKPSCMACLVSCPFVLVRVTRM